MVLISYSALQKNWIIHYNIGHSNIQFSWVQSLCCVWLFETPCTARHQFSLSIYNPWGSLKLMSIESVMPSNCLTLCHPLFLLPSLFPSIRAFSNESILHIRWPKYWSFSFNNSPSNEYSGLISFRIDWLDLLAVQGTLRIFFPTPQFNSINSALSFLYSPTLPSIYDNWRNHSSTRWTFVVKVMFLLFNKLSKLIIAFLPRSKHLLISWVQSPSAVTLEPPQNSLSLFPLLPHLFAMKWWDQMPWS